MFMHLKADTSAELPYEPIGITIIYTIDNGLQETLSIYPHGEFSIHPITLDSTYDGKFLAGHFIDSNGVKTEFNYYDQTAHNHCVQLFNQHLETADRVLVSVHNGHDDDDPSTWTRIPDEELFSNCQGEYHYVDENGQEQTVYFPFEVESIY